MLMKTKSETFIREEIMIALKDWSGQMQKQYG